MDVLLRFGHLEEDWNALVSAIHGGLKGEGGGSRGEDGDSGSQGRPPHLSFAFRLNDPVKGDHVYASRLDEEMAGLIEEWWVRPLLAPIACAQHCLRLRDCAFT